MAKGTDLTRDGDGFDTDTLALLGGLALVVFGAGLIISNKTIRQFIGNVRPGDLIGAAIPDFDRYMKLRSM